MWLRLRQIALIAQQLTTVENDIAKLFSLNPCYRDPAVGEFGLENVLFPIGNQFLEIVAPTRDGTPGGRFLTRRGGDGGYMVITQCDAHAPRRARVDALGVRIAHQFKMENFVNMQLHPADTGGAFFEIDEQLGKNAADEDGPWAPAGPDWKNFVSDDRCIAITAAEIQCGNPLEVAERWSAIAEIPLDHRNGCFTMKLSNAAIRFVACLDGRPEGLAALDISCVDCEAVCNVARDMGLDVTDNQVNLAGMRWNLFDRASTMGD